MMILYILASLLELFLTNYQMRCKEQLGLTEKNGHFLGTYAHLFKMHAFSKRLGNFPTLSNFRIRHCILHFSGVFL